MSDTQWFMTLCVIHGHASELDLCAVIVYHSHMTTKETARYETTASVVVRSDMQEELSGFVLAKKPAGARLRLGDGTTEHRFSRHNEQHRLTVRWHLPVGTHELVLEFLDEGDGQGALEIQALYIQGSPVGVPIFQGVYEPMGGEPRPGHLYMGIPGRWRFNIHVPAHHNHGGVGFA